MSKKLIAVASAAALALAGLVAIPTAANAAVFSVTVTGHATNDTARDGSTATKSAQINVPTNDVLRFVAGGGAAVTNGTALKLAVVTPGSTDAITITTTGGVKVITKSTFDSGDATSATGSATSTTASASAAELYAFTTSTAAGTAVISSGGSTQTIHISGLSTFGYKMNFTAGAATPIGGKFTLTGTVVDAFGNNLTTALAATDLQITILGGSAAKAVGVVAADADTTYAYNSTTKVYTVTGNVRDSAGSQAVSLNILAARAGTKVTAFGDPIDNVFFTITAADLSTQITALTAQVAALTADYNALATRWNKKVDSKKRVSKKVALK
jgi:hypothetical protein